MSRTDSEHRAAEKWAHHYASRRGVPRSEIERVRVEPRSGDRFHVRAWTADRKVVDIKVERQFIRDFYSIGTPA